jgi:hypothetical protein
MTRYRPRKGRRPTRDQWVVTFKIYTPNVRDPVEGFLCDSIEVTAFYRGSEAECRRIVSRFAGVGSDDRRPTSRWSHPVAGRAEDWYEFLGSFD